MQERERVQELGRGLGVRRDSLTGAWDGTGAWEGACVWNGQALRKVQEPGLQASERGQGHGGTGV